MQRFVQHHGQISDDYAHIGRLLGMAGKLVPAGCFTVTSEEEQHVVSALKQWFPHGVVVSSKTLRKNTGSWFAPHAQRIKNPRSPN